MGENPYQVDPQADQTSDDPPQLKPIRDFYSELLRTAIHDLQRYQDRHKLPPNQLNSILANHRMTVKWIESGNRGVASFDLCLEAVKIEKKDFLLALQKKGLYP